MDERTHRQSDDGEDGGETVVSSTPPPQTKLELDEKQAATIVDQSAPSDTPANYHFPELNFTYRWALIGLYALFLFLCNFVFPCILFYPLVSLTNLTIKEVIGISSAALGISSCFDSPVRLWRLTRRRRLYGPLGDDVWWHLDFSMWAYTIALLIFAIPLAIAPAVPLYNFFLMSTVMLVGPLAFIFFITIFGPKLPFRASSDPAGEKMKPAVFYVIEDVGAVDFMHGRDFRRTLHARWNASPPFQKLMKDLTIFWTASGAFYCGITAAVSWGSPIRFAFGWTLGQLFVWAGISGLICRYLAMRGLREERKWFAKRGVPREKPVSHAIV